MKFHSDGYTEQILQSHDSNNKERTSNSVNSYFAKFWGWDEEVSQRDKLRYLLFSADVNPLNENTERAGLAAPTRLYFQIRIDMDPMNGIISLSKGEITVKQAIDTGFWGVFNAGGILAEFQDVGEFSCRSIALPQ